MFVNDKRHLKKIVDALLETKDVGIRQYSNTHERGVTPLIVNEIDNIVLLLQTKSNP